MTGPEEPFGSYADLPVLVDPAITAVLDKAAHYQHEFDCDPNIPRHRIDEVLTELSSNWPLMNEEVRLSGKIRSPILETVADDDEDSEEPSDGIGLATVGNSSQFEVVDYMTADVLFRSQGFVTRETPFIIGDETVGKHHELRLFLSRTVYMHLADRSEPVELDLQCSAPADGSAHLEPVQESFEFSRIRCHEYFPETAAELEALHADGSFRIADRIDLLRDIEIPAAKYITQKEVASLSNFAHEVVGTTYEPAPFMLNLREHSPLFEAGEIDNLIQMLDAGALLVNLSGVCVYPKCVISKSESGNDLLAIDPTTLEFRLNFRVLAADPEYDSREVSVRFRDISAISSVRQSFHKEATDDGAEQSW